MILFIKRVFSVLKNPLLIKKLFYISQNKLDFKNNSKIVSSFYSFSKISNMLMKHNKKIDAYISWHYILIPAIIKSQKISSFLEIGTFNGEFVNFLANEFNSLKITTIDLPNDSDIFKTTYKRDYNHLEFIAKRDELLKKKNIDFQELDSFFLIEKFYGKEKFDLIWVDGDHKNPMVSVDIYSAINLVNNGGFILVDDIFCNKINNEYTSDESFKTLLSFQKSGLIKFNLILKRVNLENSITKKYIALVEKII